MKHQSNVCNYLSIDHDKEINVRFLFDRVYISYQECLNAFVDINMGNADFDLQELYDAYLDSTSTFLGRAISPFYDKDSFCFAEKKLLHKYIDSVRNYAITFENYRNNSHQFSVSCLFKTFNVAKDLFVTCGLIFQRRNPFIQLYKKGCQEIGIKTLPFFSLVNNSISLAFTALTGGLKDSFIQDVKDIVSQFNSNLNEKLLPADKKVRDNFLFFSQMAKSAYDFQLDFLKSQYNLKEYPMGCKWLNSQKINCGFEYYSSYGMVLEDANDKVFITFGGTVIDRICKKTFYTLITDLIQANSISLSYVVSVGLVSEIKEESKNKNIIVCGHSLGGGITQFVASVLQNTVGYTFNSAGLSKDSLKLLKCSNSKRDNIFHLRMENDLISMYGELVEGEIYFLKETTSCIKSHGIDTIINALK